MNHNSSPTLAEAGKVTVTALEVVSIQYPLPATTVIVAANQLLKIYLLLRFL